MRKSNRINNTNSFNNTNYLIRGKKNKNLKENLKKTIGSSSIITKGNSQPCYLTSCWQNFMTINTKQKLDNYKKNNALKPNRKGFG